MTRLEYVPRGSGIVEVRAHVVERTVLPQGRVTWAAVGLRAAASREIGAWIAGLGHGGERIDVSWRFWPNRPAAGAALHWPVPIGLLSLDVWAERQRFDVMALRDADRVTTRVRAANWATPALRWETRGGVARWRDAGLFGTVGAATRFEHDAVRAGIEADAWFGERSFATGRLDAGWQSSESRRGFVIDLSGVIEMVAADAPLDLWPAGDTGQARRTLLRAHPVLNGGRLRVDRLGRNLMHATAEAQHWWRAAHVAAIGAAIFIDAARVTQRPSSASQRALGDLDVGAGFRFAFPGRRGMFRADLAHGLRDGRNALSIGWSPD